MPQKGRHTLRILHCADIHLDSRMSANFDKEEAAVRRQEILGTFLDMIEEAAKAHTDHILIAGDLTDSAKVTATVRNTVLGALRDHPEMKFWYVPGNHDTGEDFLGVTEDLPDNLHVFGNDWETCSLDADGRIRLSAAAMDGTPRIGEGLSLLLNPECFNIVMLHGQAAGYHARSKAETISLSAFRGRGVDYLALGHIHSHQEGELDGRGIFCYPGCLEGRGFDECGEHGFVTLEIDEDTLRMKRHFIPFAGRCLWEIPVDVSGCADSDRMAKRIREEMDRQKAENIIHEGDLIRALLVGKIPADAEKNLLFLRRSMEKEFFHFEVEDRTGIEIDYESFRYDTSLRGEFVRLVEQAEIPEEEKAEILRCGIRELSGEVDEL